ncbi:hypothetical protein H0H87_012109 [Tephrocybe sp. NHM501043]|nr:hypothetical protein H0H87_012109 [Tephrocybe sp. NHM501043]
MFNIKTLFNHASSAIVAGAVTTQQEHVEDDFWPEYAWLYKDAPHCMGRHLICITGNWPQEMSIVIGDRPPEKSNPVETLWTVGGRIDFSKPFRLIAKLKQFSAWPLDLGFRRLGEFLAVLAYGEIPYEQWNELIIDLPNVALPYDTAAAPAIIPLDALRNLRILKWSGHRQQLRVSWLPFAPAVLQPLTALHITCDLALQDCMYILFHGTNLKEFKFKISQGFANEPVLPFDASERLRVERPMETLNLTSNDDIVPLLQPFSFPSLRHIELHLSHPTTSTFHRLDVWKNLDTAFLDCWPTVDDDVFNYGDSRAPFVGILGFTCAAIALWLYTSRRRDEENSTGSASHFVELPNEDEAAQDPSSPGVTPSTTTSLIPQVASHTAAATLPSVISVAGGMTGVSSLPGVPLAGTVGWSPPSVVAVASPSRSSLRQDTLAIRHHPPPVLEDVRLDFEANIIPPLSQEIVMTLTRMSAQAAAETHDECIQNLRHNMSLGVIARFTPSTVIDWSLSNLEKLGAGFNLLPQHDQLQPCKTMTVELPTTDEISAEDTRKMGRFFIPATVDSLTWTSHRNQLPLFTGPYLNVPRLPLEQLTLRNVEFLLRDCNIILKEFVQTLQIFQVEKLIGRLDDASANAIATNPNARVHMVKLHTLDLDSDYSPGHMLNDFEFPVIRELSLTTRRSRLSFFEDDFLTLQERWPQITTSTILGDYNESESEFIKNKLSSGGNHAHNLVAYF